MDTGMAVEACEDELRALMVRCSGDFELTGEAEAESVRYKFPADLRRQAERAEDRERSWDALKNILQVGFLLLQAGFGFMLIVSLTIILVCVAAALTAAFVAMQSQQGQGRGGGGRGGGGIGNFQRHFSALTSSRFGAMSTIRMWNELTMVWC